MKLIDFYYNFGKLGKKSITSKLILFLLIILLSSLKMHNKIQLNNTQFHQFDDLKNKVEKYDENFRKFENNVEQFKMIKQILAKIKNKFIQSIMEKKEKNVKEENPLALRENLEENHKLKYLIENSNTRNDYIKNENNSFLHNTTKKEVFEELKTNMSKADNNLISPIIVE